MIKLATIESSFGVIFICEDEDTGRVFSKSTISVFDGLESDSNSYMPELTHLLGRILNDLKGVEYDYIVHDLEESDAEDDLEAVY